MVRRIVTYLLLLPLVLLLGCSPSSPPAVQNAAVQGAVSLDHYRTDTNDTINRFIQAEYDRGIAEADAAYSAQVASHTKPDGSINAAIAQACTVQRLRNYQKVEQVRADAVAKVATINANGANAAKYLTAIGDYTKGTADNTATYQQLTQVGVDTLTAVINRWQNTPSPVIAPQPTTKP